MWCCNYRRFAVIFLTVFLVVQPVQAAAVRAYTGKINDATSGIIQHKLNKYGFAANDPRFGATLAGASSGLTAVAGGAAAVAVGAATWPAVLAGAAIATVVGGAVYLGQELLIDWLWGDDGSVQLSGQGMGSTDPGSLPAMPSTYPEVLALGLNAEIYVRYTSGSTTTVRRFHNVVYPCPASGTCLSSSYSSHKDANFVDSNIPAEGPYWANRYRTKVDNEVRVVYEYTRTPQPILPPSYESVPLTPEQAIDALPESATQSLVSPEMLAAIANATWKQAQQQAGAVPWSATDPVTAQDVSEWMAKNPTSRPTVGDLLSPVAPPGANAVPVPLPGGQVNPEPTPGEGEKIDLGIDPNTPAPKLEDTPTAEMILSPILNLMPDLRSFSVPGHSGVCPTPTFTVFDREYRWEAQCTLMEENRALLEMAMLLVWCIAGVFIVLRA